MQTDPKSEKPCCSSNPKIRKQFKKVLAFLKTINEANRLRILCFLREEEKCVCEIWRALDLPQNLVSHHLKILKDFGLISSKNAGRRIIYFSNEKEIKKYSALLNHFLISNL